MKYGLLPMFEILLVTPCSFDEIWGS